MKADNRSGFHNKRSENTSSKVLGMHRKVDTKTLNKLFSDSWPTDYRTSAAVPHSDLRTDCTITEGEYNCFLINPLTSNFHLSNLTSPLPDSPKNVDSLGGPAIRVWFVVRLLSGVGLVFIAVAISCCFTRESSCIFFIRSCTVVMIANF